MDITASELVNRSSGIYALPEIHDKLNQQLDDPDSTNEQISQIIQLDSGLSSSLLKIVNSALYGFPSAISTISQAISILGRRELTDLVFGKSAISVFKKLNIDPVDLQIHWNHSLYCGLIAKQTAKTLEDTKQSPDSLFIAGLLHDIGRLVLWQELPELSKKVLNLSHLSPLENASIEKATLGFTHAEVGKELLMKWKLPQLLIDTTNFHHEPEKSKNYKQACQIINFSDITSRVENIDSEGYSRLNDFTQIKNMKITQNDLLGITQIAQQQLSEMTSMFL